MSRGRIGSSIVLLQTRERTGITETQLKGAPKYSNDNAWNWSDPARTRAVNDYYGIAM
jgi:hypothetical protein